MTFCKVVRMTSAVRKASGMVIRRLALRRSRVSVDREGKRHYDETHESSRVRSNHWTLAVIMAFCWMTMR